MNLKIAVAGCGNIGRIHAEILDSFPEVEDLFLADPIVDFDIIKKGKVRETFKFYENIEACDAVVIALPTSQHEEAVDYFSKRKIPMLIEKPLDIDSQKSAHILEMTRSRSVRLCVV